jgi:hypothetical protein
MTTCYTGPSGVFFTPDELLILWAELCRHATPENQMMRDKIKAWLESRELNGAISGA